MINLMKDYLRETQTHLFTDLYLELKNYYNNIEVGPHQGYIFAKGEIPVVLVAHLDTVFDPKSRHTMAIFYDKEQQIMWSPDGLGTDDRAGVVMIMWLLKHSQLRPHILFTTDEETNLRGAQFAATCLKIHPNFVIELDRQGRGESVFYNCDNKDFEDYINGFGFHTCRGSYTDISILCPEWGCAGVNLSVGYYDEHSYVEYWSADDFLYTYNRVFNILEDCQNHKVDTKFKYIPKKEKNKGEK